MRSSQLSKTVLKGYHNVTPADRFPAIFVYITVDPAHVDVNIHPRKEEVQFLHARVVEQLVQEQIRKTLESHLSQQLQKTVTIKQDSWQPQGMGMQQPSRSFAYAPAPDIFSTPAFEQPEMQMPVIETQSPVFQTFQRQAEPFFDAEYRLMGQLHKTYILLEHPEGLFLVDQHAAHERILYEKFGSRFSDIATIRLMFPQVITLSRADIAQLLLYTELFASLGVEFEQCADDQIMVTSTAVHAKDVPLDDIFKLAVSLIAQSSSLDKREMEKQLSEKLRAQMACKAAVKAGDELSISQMTQLLQDVQTVDNRFTCPHGRPTSWLIRLYDVEKQFKRKL